MTAEKITAQGLLVAAAAREAIEMALPSIEKVLQRPMGSGFYILW